MSTRDRICYLVVALALVALVAEFARGQTRVGPDQLRAPRVVVMTCTKSPTATADCAGLYFVDLVTAAGTPLKIVGTIQPEAVNAADWTVVP